MRGHKINFLDETGEVIETVKYVCPFLKVASAADEYAEEIGAHDWESADDPFGDEEEEINEERRAA